jgi:hypothetical protein
MLATAILPIPAYLAAVSFILWMALSARPGAAPVPWIWPAALCGSFTVLSAVAVWREGLLQFWDNHATTWVGNQVWVDLLLAVAIAFAALAPRARRLGLWLLPWALLVVATASIGLLAMLARMAYLEARRAAGAGS